MSFPSPIPHPLAWWSDAPGFILEALEWVVGVQWPEGNEKLTWDLSDQWYAAANDLHEPIDAIKRGGPSIVEGWGGPYTELGDLIDQVWRFYADNPDAGLQYLALVLHEIGDMVDQTACDIESAKVEMYIELAFMIGELLFLIGAAFFTAGASSAAGPAVMAGGRWAIQRVFRELLKRLLERGLKTVTKDAVKSASKKITKDSLKRFGKASTKHALREGAEEFGTEYAIEMHQIASGHRQDGLDALSLGMSLAGGAAGGAFGGLAGLGPNARTGLGHTFEAMGRGAAGEAIAETGASLVTGQGLPDGGNIARAFTSGARSGLTDHTTETLHGIREDIHEHVAHLSTSAIASPGGHVDLTQLGSSSNSGQSLSSTGATTTSTTTGGGGHPGGSSYTGGTAGNVYAGGSDSGGTTYAGGGYVGAGQDGVTIHSGTDIAGTTVHGGTHVTVDTSAGPAAASVPGMTTTGYATADLAGVATVNPTQGLDVSQPGPATPGLSNPAGLSGVPGQANPSGPVAFVPGVGTPNVTTPNVPTPGVTMPGVTMPGVAGPGSSTTPSTTPGGTTPGTATPGTATPGVNRGTSAVPSSGLSTPTVPTPTRPPTPPGPSVPTGPTVPTRPSVPTGPSVPAGPGVNPTPVHHDPGQANHGPRIAPVVSPIVAPRPSPSHGHIPDPTGTPTHPGPDGRRRRVETENEIEQLRAERVKLWGEAEFRRREDARRAFDVEINALEATHADTRRQLSEAVDYGDLEGADQLQQRIDDQARTLRDLDEQQDNVMRDPIGVIPVSDEMHRILNTDYADVVDGGIEVDDVSALTGTGAPPPVEDSRGYDERGGHRRPLRWDQALLERLVPRDGAGRPVRFASVFGEWFSRLNDSGPSADPTRGINCVDCLLSFVDTWFHARPRVSAPRTFDAYPDGQVRLPLDGQLGGMQRITDALGTDFTTTYTEDSVRYDTPEETLHERLRELERSLLDNGTGSLAALAHEMRDGGSHTWLAINQDGTVVYVDPQHKIATTTPPYTTYGPHGITRLDVAAITPAGHPLHVTPDPHQAAWEGGDPTGHSGHPSPTPGAEIPDSDFRSGGRDRSQPDVSQAELAAAVTEVRAQLPKLWVRVADGTHVEFVRAYRTDSFVAARVEVGPVEPGLMTQTHVDPETGEHVITVSPRIGPNVVARAVVDAAAELVGPDMPTARPNAGLLTQLDVLASDRTWVSHELMTENAKPRPNQATVARLEARLDHLTTEFRTVAERVGILEPDGQPHDSDTAERRSEIQPTLGDGARAWLARISGSSARSFLPLSEDFQRPFDALDYVAYYMDHVAPPEARLAFAQQFVTPPIDPTTGQPVRTPLAEYLSETIDTFNKKVYKKFFPSTSKERPLTPEETAAAEAMVRPFVAEATHRLEEMQAFCAKNLGGVPFDQVIAQGTQAWEGEFERLKAAADDIVRQHNYKGTPLGYIGSMVVGRRGPHKASTHTNLRKFDLDLYVLYPSDFDDLYDAVKASDARVEEGAERLSRGKIFAVEDITDDLNDLVDDIRRDLARAFPGNEDAAGSDIVLRREPPY